MCKALKSVRLFNRHLCVPNIILLACIQVGEGGGGGHGGRVVTALPPTSGDGVRVTALSQVGKLVFLAVCG